MLTVAGASADLAVRSQDEQMPAMLVGGRVMTFVVRQFPRLDRAIPQIEAATQFLHLGKEGVVPMIIQFDIHKRLWNSGKFRREQNQTTVFPTCRSHHMVYASQRSIVRFP